jgi:hypothetical protein
MRRRRSADRVRGAHLFGFGGSLAHLEGLATCIAGLVGHHLGSNCGDLANLSTEHHCQTVEHGHAGRTSGYYFFGVAKQTTGPRQLTTYVPIFVPRGEK